MPRRILSWTAALSAAFLFVPSTDSDPANAGERVGVAAAVKPQASSTPPGAGTRRLEIGKSVVYNERIATSETGVVQVLLLDGSTFTVGPGSNLVIDKYIYNPQSGKGALVATFSKGAIRFVGGKLSKGAPGITVKTPAGVLTVRGGIFQGVVRGANQALFAFVYGNHLTLNRGGRLYTLRTAGNVFAISGPGAPVMRPATAADTTIILAAVSGRKTKIAKGPAIRTKGQRWPYYYGIQPTGRYPDEPFIRELYYDGAYGDIARSSLRRVPIPEIRPPVLPAVDPPPPPPPTPPPPPPPPTPPPPVDNITGPLNRLR